MTNDTLTEKKIYLMIMKNMQVQMILFRILREAFEAYTEQKQSSRNSVNYFQKRLTQPISTLMKFSTFQCF